MIQEVIQAFMLIFVAEMGDKTQILAMAFATKYPIKKVLLGIFLGSLINHGLAVLLGSYISNFVPIDTIQIIAGFAFIGFALWTLRGEEDDEEEETGNSKYGAVFTVGLAFFIGELGDKTQLTAITLATDAIYPWAILIGTVLGMIVTGGIGIFIGKTLGNKVPELVIKFVAAGIFMFFGVSKLLGTLPKAYLKAPYILVFSLIIVSVLTWMIRTLFINRRKGIVSAYTAEAQRLYDYYHHIQEDVNKICLGLDNCKSCSGNECAIGYTKSILNKTLANLNGDESELNDKSTIIKDFDIEKVIDSLVDTLVVILETESEEGIDDVHQIRNQFEKILFGKELKQWMGLNSYESEIMKLNSDIANQVKYKYNSRIKTQHD